MKHEIRSARRALVALLCLAPAAAPASVRIVPAAPPDPRAGFDAACADAASPACARAVAALSAEAAKVLAEAPRRSGADVRASARLAADAADPALRAAAAAALAYPVAEPVDTPILAELLDDPVPAVRTAAQRALWSSQDERGQRLARRAEAFGGNRGDSLAEDAEPARAALGVTLPADAVYLHFASDPSDGVYAFHTAGTADKVLAAVRGKGEGPFTVAQFRAWVDKQAEASESAAADLEVAEGEMPSPEQMAKMMEMAMKVGEAMNTAQAEGKSQAEVASAAAAAMGQSLPVDAGIADPLENAELFTEPRIVVVPVGSGLRAVVAVYADRAVGGTGITVQRPPLN